MTILGYQKKNKKKRRYNPTQNEYNLNVYTTQQTIVQ